MSETTEMLEWIDKYLIGVERGIKDYRDGVTSIELLIEVLKDTAEYITILTQ